MFTDGNYSIYSDKCTDHTWKRKIMKYRALKKNRWWQLWSQEDAVDIHVTVEDVKRFHEINMDVLKPTMQDNNRKVKGVECLNPKLSRSGSLMLHLLLLDLFNMSSKKTTIPDYWKKACHNLTKVCVMDYNYWFIFIYYNR